MDATKVTNSKQNFANNTLPLPGCANPFKKDSTALVDTAANISLLTAESPATDANLQLSTKTILHPAGAIMVTTKTVNLLLKKLPTKARQTHRVPGIINSFLSVPVLVDTVCELFFHRTGCDTPFNGETIIRGWRDTATNMWRISLQDSESNKFISDDDDANCKLPALFANHIYKYENLSQLIQFYHATMASPVVSTLCKAIDARYFQGWPSLTSKRVRDHTNVVDEMEMGHMEQRRTGIRSARPKPKQPPRPTPDQEMADKMECPPQSPNNDPSGCCIACH